MTDFEQQYYEADSFWERDLDDQNIQRIKETEAFIPANIETLLDAGCGNGVFCNYLNQKERFKRITGLDRSKTALAYLKTENFIGDVNNMPFNDNEFDCVSCLEVIEHLPVDSYKKTLKELCRVAKKSIIVSVPYNEKIEENVTQCPNCKTIFNYDLHLRSFNGEKMNNLLDDYGFQCKKTKVIGSHTKYMGIDLYLKLFYSKEKPDYLSEFNSPICPICGFQKEKEENTQHQPLTVSSMKPQTNVFSIAKKVGRKIWPVFRQLWPKVNVDGYWIVALYERKN